MSTKRKKSTLNDDSPSPPNKKSKLTNEEKIESNGKGKGKSIQQVIQEDPPSELDQDTLRQFQSLHQPEKNGQSNQDEAAVDSSEESEQEPEEELQILVKEKLQRQSQLHNPHQTTSNRINNRINNSTSKSPGKSKGKSKEFILANLPKEILWKYLPPQIESVRKVFAGAHPTHLDTEIQSNSSKQKGKGKGKGKEIEVEIEAATASSEEIKSECLGLESQRKALNLILEQTVRKGQSNSALMIGAGGCGKSLLLHSVLSSLSLPPSSTSASNPTSSSKRSFYHVSLSGVLQPTDRLAMRELARQLIEQGAFGEGEFDMDDDEEEKDPDQEEDGDGDPKSIGDDDEELTAALQVELEEEEERKREELERNRRENGWSGVENHDDRDGEGDQNVEDDEEEREEEEERERRILEENRKRIEEVKRVNLENAMMSSLANTMSSIMSLLSPQDSTTQTNSNQANTPTKSKKDSTSRASLPLIISLDSFDLFTSRPRQALLYCLLDTVQAGSYTSGLSVIGMTRRVDTVDLLEKRVKSRFSHRLIHVVPPTSEAEDCWKDIVRQAFLNPPKLLETESQDDGSSGELELFRKAWRSEVEELFRDSSFAAVLHDCWEISGDVREMYRILMRGFTQISIDDPYLRPNSFAIASEEDAVDLSMEILNELTTTEFALLIASKHLTLRSIPDFTFEQCLDEIKRFEKKTRREIESSGLGTSTISKGKSKQEDGGKDEMKLEGEDGLAHRDRAMMAFQSLLSLSLFIPTSTLSSLSIPLPAVHANSLSTLHQAGSMVSRKPNSTRLEYVKVRCSIEIGEIKEALNLKARNNKSSSSGGVGTIREEVLKWGLSMATT